MAQFLGNDGGAAQLADGVVVAPAEQEGAAAIRLYAASAIGAFMLGLGDLLNNGKAATVLKISEMIKTNLYPPMEHGGLVALFGLIVLGTAMCWIFRPPSMADAFARGFSLYAMLAVAAPYQTPAGLARTGERADAAAYSSFWISAAHAQEAPAGGATGKLLVTIEPQGEQAVTVATLTVRELDTGAVVGSGDVDSNAISVIQPTGRYLLEIEAEGFRRSAVEIEIKEGDGALSIPLSPSAVPSSLQRLYSPARVNAQLK